MTVIRPNSVSGITSITAQANEINFFRSNGTLAGLQLNGVNFNTTTGVSTFNNLDVGGVLTYQDVTNVDSVGIITARSTIDAQGAINLADSIIHTGDADTKIRFPAADTISFETSGAEKLRITSDGKVGINKTPDTSGGLVQIRYNEVYTSGTTNLLTSASKAALRIQTSSDSSKSLYFGGIDEAATPYLQVGNMSSASGGATATYPLVFQPFGGQVLIGRTSASHSSSTMEILSTGSEAYLRISPNTNTGTAGVVFGTADDHSTGGIYYNGSDDSLVLAGHNNTERLRIDSSGHVLPGANNTYDLGTTSVRWRNLYAEELNVTKASGNLSAYFTATNGLGTLEVGGSTGAFIDLRMPSSDDFDLRIGTGGSGGYMNVPSGQAISITGNFNPAANNTYDLGATGTRWRNIYTNDLNLSNEGGANDVDNTWGDYTIQEGESNLFLINNRNGKKYKFNLTEVS